MTNYNLISKRFLILLFCSFFIAHFATAQDKLTGRIFENKSKVFLGGISVEDLKSHLTVVSDSTGRFSIVAKIGDFICFSGFAYRSDTLYIKDLKYIEIYLDLRQNMLNEVKVVTQQLKTGSLSAPAQTGPLGSHTVVYQTDGDGNNIGGLKIKIFDWDKDEKKKERDNKIASNEEKQLNIFNIFKPKNLGGYLPIKGVEMDNFIILYTPDVATFYGIGFNLTSYLNTCYQDFLKYPAEQRQSDSYFRLVKKSDP